MTEKPQEVGAETAPQRPQRKNSTVRDLVTMGIFIALYVLLFTFCGMFMAVAPIIMVLLPAIFGLFGGVIFTVLLGKVQRPGAFLFTGLLIGVFMIQMAPAGIMCWMTILGGVLGEIIYNVMGRKSFRSMTVAYSVFIFCFSIGEYVPFVWMKDAYLALYAGQASEAVARQGTQMLNPLIMVIFIMLGLVASVAGCYWGRAMTSKQFKRAGIL